jgi:histidinol phosphatase-like PHP family hydrolase
VSPHRACEIASARGLNALLFTEHGRYWQQQPLKELQSLFPDLKLYSGIEIALVEGYHVVAFGSRLVDQPVFSISLSQLRELVAAERDNVFLFIAHAFRYQLNAHPDLEQLMEICDGMEMNSINILRGRAMQYQSRIVPANHATYEQYLHNYGLVPLYNTDGHDEEIIGLISNDLGISAPPEDEVALARIFKLQPPVEYQNKDLLAKHPLLDAPE